MQPFTKMKRLSDVAIADVEQSVAGTRNIARMKTGMPTPEGIQAPVIPENVPIEGEAGPSALDVASQLTQAATGGKTRLGAQALKIAQESGALPEISKNVGRALQKTGRYALPTTAGLSGISSMGAGGPLQMPEQGQGQMGMAPGALSANPFLSLTGQAPAYLMPIAQQAMIGMFAPQLLGSAPTAQAAEAANKLQQVQSAASQLPALLQQYQAAGGAQGGILGRARGLADTIFGGPAAAYGPQSQQLATQLSQATGTPVTLPGIAQTETAAQGTLAQLLAALNAYGVNPGMPQTAL
jgi:hypothetical protein